MENFHEKINNDIGYIGLSTLLSEYRHPGEGLFSVHVILRLCCLSESSKTIELYILAICSSNATEQQIILLSFVGKSWVDKYRLGF